MDGNFLHNLEKGVAAQRKGKYDKAIRRFNIALRREPNHPLVNTAIGTCYIQKEMYGHALRHLMKAHVIDPTLSEPYCNIGVSLRNLGDEEQALMFLEKGLEKFPQDAGILGNAGSVAFTLGRWEKAEGYLRRAIKIDPKNAGAHWNLGLCLLTQGKYKEGWPEYDWGVRAGERFARPYWNEYPEWLDEDINGKTLVVWGEQGLGDEILFSGCLQFLKGANVILDCHPRLKPIFERSFPDIKVVGGRKDMNWTWLAQEEVDHFIPIGSLPGQFPDQFPESHWLYTEKDRVETWAKRLGAGRKIGISWAGGSDKNARARRSMPLKEFMAPFQHLDVTWVSLQYGDVFNEIASFVKGSGVNIFHDQYAIDEYDETAHLVEACDLILTIPTAVGHLAGALGKPCWVMTPQASPWRWPLGTSHPWYRTVTMYHQEERHDWQPVLDLVAKDLETFLAI
jgi:hypothetical protein